MGLLLLGNVLYTLNLKYDFIYEMRRSQLSLDQSLYTNLDDLRKVRLHSHPQTIKYIESLTHNASLGEPKSQLKLAQEYKYGFRVKKDALKADMWFQARDKKIEFKKESLIEITPFPKHISLSLLPDDVCESFLDDRKFSDKILQAGIDKEHVRRIRLMGTVCGRTGYCKATDQCGEIIGIDCNSGGDGPYTFVNLKTMKSVGGCSFWHGKCKLPREWRCNAPPNYRG